MRAIVYGEEGAGVADIPVPKLADSDVLVRINVCALNRVDLFMAEGRTHGSRGGPGTVLGTEWAGVVEATGANVPSHICVGQRVMGSGKGAFAEYAVADWGRVLLIPESIHDAAEAACLPVALQTMYDAVVTQGRIRRGDSMLVHGASSGVGLMALQIAQFYGASWICGSSTSPAKRQHLRSCGVNLTVDSTLPGWADEILEATGGRGVDLVIDMLSGDIFNATMAATAIEGRIVNVGRLGGRASTIDFDLHALRRISYVGVTFRTRTVDEVRIITSSMMQDLAAPLAAGCLKLPIDREFSFAQYKEALMYMKSNQHFGKIILRVT